MIIEEIEESWNEIHPFRHFSSIPVREEKVRALAHQLWIRRGSPMDGDPKVDWLEAERLISGPISEAPKRLVWALFVGENDSHRRVPSEIVDLGTHMKFKFNMTVEHDCRISSVALYLTETDGIPIYTKRLDHELVLGPGYSMELALTIGNGTSKEVLDLLRSPVIQMH